MQRTLTRRTRYHLHRQRCPVSDTDKRSGPGNTLIQDWQELAQVPDSATHRLEIDVEGGNGWIIDKAEADKRKIPIYLSTHTFYGSNHQQSTALLQSCGFNVELANWDDESNIDVSIKGDGIAYYGLLIGVGLLAGFVFCSVISGIVSHPWCYGAAAAIIAVSLLACRKTLHWNKQS